jgi:hypothetical protein
MPDPALQLSCDCRALCGQVDPNRAAVSLVVNSFDVSRADQRVHHAGQRPGADGAPISHLVVEEPSIAVECHQNRGASRAQPIGLRQVSAPPLGGEMPGHGHQPPEGSVVEMVGQGHPRMLGP